MDALSQRILPMLSEKAKAGTVLFVKEFLQYEDINIISKVSFFLFFIIIKNS
jgi:hypothetical protein